MVGAGTSAEGFRGSERERSWQLRLCVARYAFVIGDPGVVNVEFIALNGFILALAIGADYKVL